MNKKRLTKNDNKAKYVKIRQYVVDTVMTASGKPERLESMRDLARRFDVSFATIQRALGTLIDEGLLTVRSGVGIYTNPEPNAERRQHKVIAVVTGSGRMLYYDNFFWDLIAAAGKQATDHFYYLHMVNLIDSEKDLDVYLNSLDLVGVFWLCPTIGGLGQKWEAIARAVKCPLVTFNAATEGVGAVSLDFDHTGYLVGQYFAQHGVRSPLVVKGGEDRELPLAGFRRAWQEAGRPEVPAAIDTNIELAGAIRERNVDGLVFFGGMLRGGGEILLENRLEKMLIAGDLNSWNFPLPGVAIEYDFDEIARKLWSAMECAWAGESPVHELVRSKLVPMNP